MSVSSYFCLKTLMNKASCAVFLRSKKRVPTAHVRPQTGRGVQRAAQPSLRIML
jgi:hypothetical protein